MLISSRYHNNHLLEISLILCLISREENHPIIIIIIDVTAYILLYFSYNNQIVCMHAVCDVRIVCIAIYYIRNIYVCWSITWCNIKKEFFYFLFLLLQFQCLNVNGSGRQAGGMGCYRKEVKIREICRMYWCEW